MDRRQIRIEYLESSLKENPHDPFIQYALSMEYKTIDPGHSIKLLKELIDTNPDYIPSYYTLAQLMIEKNNSDQAIIILDKGKIQATNQKDLKALSEINALKNEIELEED